MLSITVLPAENTLYFINPPNVNKSQSYHIPLSMTNGFALLTYFRIIKRLQKWRVQTKNSVYLF